MLLFPVSEFHAGRAMHSESELLSALAEMPFQLRIQLCQPAFARRVTSWVLPAGR